MASIGTESGGRKRILFYADDGSRKTIRLGVANQKQAGRFMEKVEALIRAKAIGMDEATADWLASLPQAMHNRLAKVGLVKARQVKDAAKLGRFITDYLAQRGDLKPGTLIVMRQAERWLVRFLGKDKPLVEVTTGDADSYRAFLQSEKRAKATVVKWCRYARHYFEVAKRRKLVSENPFAHIRGSIHGNPARRVFIPEADVRKVLKAAPDRQWKLLIALGRWGGLRIPSEALALTWHDVDFAGRRFIVRATKTEHHEDGGIRVVPMFPELVEHFQAVFDAAPEGSTHVITRYRDAGQNLRTQLVRYITTAGLKPWPKPWQNMRASRATDLADKFPSHVCNAWLGHTEAVANEFYRQVTDSHFGLAIGATPVEAIVNGTEKSGTISGTVPSGMAGMEQKIAAGQTQESPNLLGNSASCDMVRNGVLGDEGFEPPTSSV